MPVWTWLKKFGFEKKEEKKEKKEEKTDVAHDRRLRAPDKR